MDFWNDLIGNLWEFRSAGCRNWAQDALSAVISAAPRRGERGIKPVTTTE